MTSSADPRRFAPATARNRDPILAILRRALPVAGTVLEIASGSGEHAVHFARALPHLDWQPTDPSADALASIAAWRAMEGTANLRAPIMLDASDVDWPVDAAAAIVAINMVHISPWAATLGLLAGAGRLLPSGGLLYLYGPYRQAGRELAPGNAAFDADLRRRDPAWGLREVDDVAAAAEAEGLALVETIEMPANNLSLLFRRG
jgi:SAM-dependent methyltransferase